MEHSDGLLVISFSNGITNALNIAPPRFATAASYAQYYEQQNESLAEFVLNEINSHTIDQDSSKSQHTQMIDQNCIHSVQYLCFVF
jgi:hypothetical protein